MPTVTDCTTEPGLPCRKGQNSPTTSTPEVWSDQTDLTPRARDRRQKSLLDRTIRSASSATEATSSPVTSSRIAFVVIRNW